MRHADRLKAEMVVLQERLWRDLEQAVVHGEPGTNRATAPLGESPIMTAKSLLESAESLAPDSPVQVGGIPIIVSPYVPTTEDRVVLYERPLLLRIFSGQLFGVRVEEVSCDHIFLMEHEGRRTVVCSPAAAAVLRVYPEVRL